MAGITQYSETVKALYDKTTIAFPNEGGVKYGLEYYILKSKATSDDLTTYTYGLQVVVLDSGIGVKSETKINVCAELNQAEFLAKKLLNDKVLPEEIHDYLNNTNHLEYRACAEFPPTISTTIFPTSPPSFQSEIMIVEVF